MALMADLCFSSGHRSFTANISAIIRLRIASIISDYLTAGNDRGLALHSIHVHTHHSQVATIYLDVGILPILHVFQQFLVDEACLDGGITKFFRGDEPSIPRSTNVRP